MKQRSTLVAHIICLFLFMGTLTVQGQVYVMNPCVDFTDDGKEYDELLEKVLTDNFTENYILRYVSEPSFDPEYLFQIREIDSSYFEIEAVVFQESLWEALIVTKMYVAKEYITNFNTKAFVVQGKLSDKEFILDSVKRDVYKRDIDKTLVHKIDELFNVFTSSMNETDMSIIIEDGVGYRFKRKTQDGVICGEAWSPDEDSPLGELVSICDDLTEYAKGEDLDLTQLEERIDELYESIYVILWQLNMRPDTSKFHFEWKE